MKNQFPVLNTCRSTHNNAVITTAKQKHSKPVIKDEHVKKYRRAKRTYLSYFCRTHFKVKSTTVHRSAMRNFSNCYAYTRSGQLPPTNGILTLRVALGRRNAVAWYSQLVGVAVNNVFQLLVWIHYISRVVAKLRSSSLSLQSHKRWRHTPLICNVSATKHFHATFAHSHFGSGGDSNRQGAVNTFNFTKIKCYIYVAQHD